MRRFDDNLDLVVHRGPVSGTGEALSDKDALRILDEWVDPSEGGVPDIGIVIDPEQPQLPTEAAQQELPSERGEPGPDFMSWRSGADWPSMRQLFGPEAPRRIFRAQGLQTPIRTVLKETCDFPDAFSGKSTFFDAPIVLRVLSSDSLIDLILLPEDCRQLDLTLFDLMARSDPKHFLIQTRKW
jgi:hypothetical protein